MSRDGVSYDQVLATIEELRSENIKPTLRNVRARLGSGSNSTIQLHMAKWREAHSQAAATSEIPAQFAKAYSQEINRVKSELRSEIAEQLVLAQTDAADLAEAGEMLEAELDKRAAEILELTKARDMLQGQSQVQACEIERLVRENERERKGAEAARVEAAQMRNMVELQTERLAELSGTMDRLMAVNAAEAQARSIAEKAAAILDAKLQSELERSMALVREKEALLELVAAERQSGEAARISSAQTSKEIEHLAATLVAKESEIREISEFFEAEKNARIGADMKIAALVSKLEEQEKAMNHLHELLTAMHQ